MRQTFVSPWIIALGALALPLWLAGSRTDFLSPLLQGCVLAVLSIAFWYWRRNASPLPWDDALMPCPAAPPAAALPATALPATATPAAALPAKGRAWPWLLAAWTVAVSSVAILEWRRHFYFVQDDNFSMHLPTMVHGFRMIWTGVWPEWNVYQLLGTPMAEIGVDGFTYPPTHLAYAIARHVLGNEYALIDVFCWLHLAAGIAACFWLARRLRCSAPVSAAFALCLCLSGYILIYGRQNYQFLALIVWTPLLFAFVLDLRARPNSLARNALTALAIGMFCHSPHIQMCFYALSFTVFLALHLAATGAIPWTHLRSAIPAWIFGVAIGAILLVPQYLASRDALRFPIGGGIGHGVWAMLFPYPLTMVAPAYDYGWGHPHMEWDGQFYFAGGLLTIACAASLAYLLMRRGGLSRILGNPWLCGSVVAFLLSLGPRGGLWWLHAHLPLVRAFRTPWKFLFFVHLFSLLAGALILDRWASRGTAPARRRAALFAVVAAIVSVHSQLCWGAFANYADLPYPALPAPMRHELLDGPQTRVFTIANGADVVQKGFLFSLDDNFATVFGVQSLQGYETLVGLQPSFLRVLVGMDTQPAATLRRYGVTHVIVYGAPSERRDWLPPHPALIDGAIRIFHVDHPDAQAFSSSGLSSSTPLPVSVHPNHVDVNLAGFSGGDITVNYLWRERSRAYVDGTPVALHADPWGRIVATVPAAGADGPGGASGPSGPSQPKILRLTYEGRWTLGFAAFGALAALAAWTQFSAPLFVARRRQL